MRHVEKDTPERELVAVMGSSGLGVYYPKFSGKGVVYIDSEGKACESTKQNLEDLLNEHRDRTPIYRGEEHTFKF